MDGWTLSEKRPGYRCKTIQAGKCTVVIYRPILSDEERKRREAQIINVLAHTQFAIQEGQ